MQFARMTPSCVNCIFIHSSRAVLYEFEALGRIAAHEPLDDIPRRLALFIFAGKGDLDERARGRAHRRFLELVWVHFAKALEARNVDLLALELRGFELGAVGVIAGVEGLGSG